jgi:hypothetical protein
MFCEIWGPQSGVYEDTNALVVTRVLGRKSLDGLAAFLRLRDPDDDGNTVLRNVGKYSSSGTVSCHRKLVLSVQMKNLYSQDRWKTCTVRTDETLAQSGQMKNLYSQDRWKTCTVRTDETLAQSGQMKHLHSQDRWKTCTVRTDEKLVQSGQMKNLHRICMPVLSEYYFPFCPCSHH